MQAFELLGGKYQQGEQILPGAIQTFRSYEIPTGRPVFIHRIASNDPAALEISRLLSLGLTRSPAVRKMLLDVYEGERYRFVVTEPARECVPLREWLERESDAAIEGAPNTAATAEAPVQLESAPPETLAPPAERARREAPVPAAEAELGTAPSDADASEFARLFHAALSGKLERSRGSPSEGSAASRLTAADKPALEAVEKTEPVDGPISRPAIRAINRPAMAAPAPKVPPEHSASVPPSVPATQPDMFSQLEQTETASKSRLILLLVVLGVLLALLVMFIVVFVKR